MLHASALGLPYMLERAGLDVQQGNCTKHLKICLFKRPYWYKNVFPFELTCPYEIIVFKLFF